MEIRQHSVSGPAAAYGAGDLPARHAPAIAPERVREALASVLGSPVFAKSPCMRRLLRFVVERSVADAPGPLTEYSIGLEALGKHPDRYSPGDDPSVRVQMGRLRERLRRYYREEGRRAALRFDIPQGGYAATVSMAPRALAAAGTELRQVLGLAAIEGLDREPASSRFAQGLSEELLHGVFHALRGLVAVAPMAQRSDADAAPDPDLRLEGRLCQEDGRRRVFVRLIDQRTRCLLWCARFDAAGEDGLQAQEALAAAIGRRLRQDVFALPAAQRAP